MTFPANIQSATPAKYLFELISETRSVICDPEPLEWGSGTFTMNRDLEVGGVFSSFMNSLTFVGSGADLLRKLWNAYGFNAKCELAIYYFKDSTREYKEFPFRFDINFNIYEVVKVGKFAFGIKIKAVNNSLQTKFDNRKDVDVNIAKSVSVGGVTIQDHSGNKTIVNYEETNYYHYGRWYKSDYSDLPRRSGMVSYTSIPFEISYNGYSECRSVAYKTRMQTVASLDPFFLNALFDYDFTFYYSLMAEVSDKHEGNPWTINVYEIDYNGAIQNTYLIQNFGDTEGTFIYENSLPITCHQGNSLVLAVEVTNATGIKATVRNNEISISQQVISTPAKKTTGFPIYEAFEKVLQHIMDIQWPFYSEFFGRTDTYKNLSNQFYSTENQLRFAHLQGGLNLRGVNIGDSANSFTLNYKDLFKTAQSIWNVGYAFETVEGNLRLRIEEYAYFFDSSGDPVLDLSDRINKYDIISIVMPELAPVQLNSGFNSFEYLQLNGRAEPNTTNKRTSIINTDSKFDNIAPFRGDTKGILSALADPIDTTDTKSDNNVFIIKTQKYNSSEWKPEKDENITIEDNSSIFGEDQLNRYFTPSRMLIRHANKFKAAFTTDDLKASQLTFQSSDKLQTLKTSGEGYILSENDDILLSDLPDPIYRPIKHTIECWFDYSDLEAIIEKPLGWIKFSDTISGYLLTLKKKNNEAKAEITIIERYVS